jgi:cytoskeletal protein CcmA (bactofilin family)/DNA-directed RNA polymerase subunit RPC12/RpoP
MPATKQDKVLVACPHCGHQQPEPRAAFSTNCKKCGQHFHVQEALNPARKTPARQLDLRRIICFECGAELDVPASAESTMCKRCSRYVDMHDYRIANAIAKNFKTKGVFTVEPRGYVFNTESIAGEVIIKGSLAAAHLIIPAENHFRWPDVMNVGSVEIAGELAANLRATGTITLKSSARMFGDLEADGLVVEVGAVVVGKMRIGLKINNK